MRRDGKKEIPASIGCLTMLLRCLHDSSMDPLRLDGSATIHHGGATNAHDASTIRYGASTIQAISATVASRPPTNVHDLVVGMWQLAKLCHQISLFLRPLTKPVMPKRKTSAKSKESPDPPLGSVLSQVWLYKMMSQLWDRLIVIPLRKRDRQI